MPPFFFGPVSETVGIIDQNFVIPNTFFDRATLPTPLTHRKAPGMQFNVRMCIRTGHDHTVFIEHPQRCCTGTADFRDAIVRGVRVFADSMKVRPRNAAPRTPS